MGKIILICARACASARGRGRSFVGRDQSVNNMIRPGGAHVCVVFAVGSHASRNTRQIVSIAYHWFCWCCVRERARVCVIRYVGGRSPIGTVFLLFRSHFANWIASAGEHGAHLTECASSLDCTHLPVVAVVFAPPPPYPVGPFSRQPHAPPRHGPVSILIVRDC